MEQTIINLIESVRAIIKRLAVRKPANKYIMLALSGSALMVWTPTGNIVLSTQTARKLSRHLDLMADKAEEYHDNYSSI